MTRTVTRRVVSLWLPRLATDRLCRQQQATRPRKPPPSPAKPHITVAAKGGDTLRLTAVDLAAQTAGLFPGQALVDARTLEPGVSVDDADPASDLAMLERFATWCGRYTPWTSIDGLENSGAGGLWLDVTGCTHLFAPGQQGEAALIDDLVRRFATAGYTARAGLADTPGAAWATARFTDRFASSARETACIVPPGKQQNALAALPIAALRLPTETVAGLDRLGLRCIGDLTALPRTGLARRFGKTVTRRLDQALGHIAEPLSPRPPTPSWRVCLNPVEPLGEPAAVSATVQRLTEVLCKRLTIANRGVRRLELALYRVSGGHAIGTGRVDTVTAGTNRASRDAGHLLRLIGEQLDRLPEPQPESFGADNQAIEFVTLTATVTEHLPAAQTSCTGGSIVDTSNASGLDRLIDRLAARLGGTNVVRFKGRKSHLPEHAQTVTPVLRDHTILPFHPAPCPRPPRLLPRPELVSAIAPVPDDPPVLFRWQRHSHHIVRAEGPERLAPEWWRDPSPLGDNTRDYYRVEDTEGRRFWLYRDGLFDGGSSEPPRWYLHGFFG